MVNQVISPILWFLAGWQGGALFVGLVGLPAVLGFVPGIVMGVLVAWDARRAAQPDAWVGRRIRAINEVAAELDRHGDHRPATEADTRRV